MAATPVHHEGNDLYVTVSVGIVAWTGGIGFDPDVLIGAADQALYRAKANGRNRVEE